jgi:hypothetical protein
VNKYRFKKTPACRQAGITRIIFLVTGSWLLVTLIGCEAFVRKFTRKPKDQPAVEMVLAPEEYKDTRTPEQKYRESFLFWKTWHDELIESLLQNRSYKKRLDCVQEALKHLNNLRPLLKENKQKKLGLYINRLNDLQSMIDDDIYGTNNSNNYHRAEQIKMDILRDLSYNEIKNDLI